MAQPKTCVECGEHPSLGLPKDQGRMHDTCSFCLPGLIESGVDIMQPRPKPPTKRQQEKAAKAAAKEETIAGRAEKFSLIERRAEERKQKSTKDSFGQTWPNVPLSDRCEKCGQPDTDGSCTHVQIADDEREAMLLTQAAAATYEASNVTNDEAKVDESWASMVTDEQDAADAAAFVPDDLDAALDLADIRNTADEHNPEPVDA